MGRLYWFFVGAIFGAYIFPPSTPPAPTTEYVPQAAFPCVIRISNALVGTRVVPTVSSVSDYEMPVGPGHVFTGRGPLAKGLVPAWSQTNGCAQVAQSLAEGQ